jgi:regulatory protein
MPEKGLDKARSYAISIIDYRPRSEKELRARLKQKGYDNQLIEKIIIDLKQHGLIDDVKFARLVARSQSHGMSCNPSFIRRELQARGVDREIIDEAVKELKENFDEEEAARSIFNRRLKAVQGLDKNKQKTRLYRYLKRRGFSDSIIFKLLDETYRT